MKLVIISDTHNKHRALTLPPGDVLIHCGDATGRGTIEEFAAFGNWFQKQPHRWKLFVPGNHDFICEKNPTLARELLGVHHFRGVHMLVDERITIKDDNGKVFRFYGAPWVPNLEGWAFYGPHLTLVSKFAKIPADVDVLITHGPPLGVGDRCEGSHHVGSSELAQRLTEISPRVHVFGHIHEGYGVTVNQGHYTVNASNCDINYDLVNAPVVIEIE